MRKSTAIIFLIFVIAPLTNAPAHDDDRRAKLVVTPNNLDFFTRLVPEAPTPVPEPKTLTVRGIAHPHQCRKHGRRDECDTLFWKASPNQNWIKVEPDTGFTPARVTVSVDPAGLSEGEHRGEIRFDTPGQRQPRIVQVKLRIRSPRPRLALAPERIDFSAPAFQNRILAESVRVTAVGTGDVEFETKNSEPWLKVIPREAETPATVLLLAFTDSLAPGIYHDTVVFEGEDDDGSLGSDGQGNDDEELVALLPVTLTLRPDGGQPALIVVPNRLGFAANFGGPNPQPQAVLISATGGNVPWSAANTQSWLSVNPVSGIATATPSAVSVLVDIDALNPGLFADTITFHASQPGVADVKVPVFLQIFPPSNLTDSVDIVDQTVNLSGPQTGFSVPIFASNTQALRGIILPLRFDDGRTALDSVSFAGTRAEFADLKLFVRQAEPNHFLIFIGFIGAPALPPGEGIVGRLHFSAGLPAGGTDTLIIDSASVPNRSAPGVGEMALPAALSVSYIVASGPNLFILNPAFSKGIVVMQVATAADDFDGRLPREFGLGQNYPNPFNPKTAIAYVLPRASEVRLEVFDLLGRVVATLAEGHMPAGRHEVIWDGRDFSGRPVSSGIYLYRLKAGGFSETKKMLFLK